MREKVIVVGGGVIGLSVAFECARRDLDVVLLEKGRCGGQASGAAAGMLAPYSEISEDPDDFFRLCLASLKRFPQWQKDVKETSGIDFEYTNCGSLHTVFHEADRFELETRVSWQREFAIESRLLEGEELRRFEPALGDEVTAALYYPEESHLYSPDYVKSLEKACKRSGVYIWEHSGEINIESYDQEVVVQTQRGQFISGDRLVICSGAWSGRWEKEFGINIPVFPIRGQICAYNTPQAALNSIVFTSQGYFVQKENGSLVSGASEDIAGFDTSVTEKGIARLVNWGKKVIPQLDRKQPVHTWAGLRPATQDGFPLLGKLQKAPHVIFATGHYRNGILLSPITAMAVADLIEDKPSEVSLEAFRPDRF